MKNLRMVIDTLMNSLKDISSNLSFLLKQVNMILQHYCDRNDNDNIGLNFVTILASKILSEKIKVVENISAHPQDVFLPIELYEIRKNSVIYENKKNRNAINNGLTDVDQAIDFVLGKNKNSKNINTKSKLSKLLGVNKGATVAISRPEKSNKNLKNNHDSDNDENENTSSSNNNSKKRSNENTKKSKSSEPPKSKKAKIVKSLPVEAPVRTSTRVPRGSVSVSYEEKDESSDEMEEWERAAAENSQSNRVSTGRASLVGGTGGASGGVRGEVKNVVKRDSIANSKREKSDNEDKSEEDDSEGESEEEEEEDRNDAYAFNSKSKANKTDKTDSISLLNKRKSFSSSSSSSSLPSKSTTSSSGSSNNNGDKNKRISIFNDNSYSDSSSQSQESQSEMIHEEDDHSDISEDSYPKKKAKTVAKKTEIERVHGKKTENKKDAVSVTTVKASKSIPLSRELSNISEKDNEKNSERNGDNRKSSGKQQKISENKFFERKKPEVKVLSSRGREENERYEENEKEVKKQEKVSHKKKAVSTGAEDVRAVSKRTTGIRG